MSNKLLIISGITATGKTSLAVKIAKLLNGQLISADSRQIYKGLNIGTGKDHPPNIPIHLIDILTPDQAFSSSRFQRLANQKIKQIQKKGRLPIIVGGTGYYIKSLLFPPATQSIKPKPLLRKLLTPLPISVIQFFHIFLNRTNFQKLNNSEKHNRHRLIRKLEIRLSPVSFSSQTNSHPGYLHISLTAPKKTLYQHIDKRINSRLKLGLINEINHLLKTYKWSDPGLNTLAYKEFKPYFKNKSKKILNLCIQKWRQHEYSYARRQITWFTKRPNLHIFDIDSPQYPTVTIDLISKWYNKI